MRPPVEKAAAVVPGKDQIGESQLVLCAGVLALAMHISHTVPIGKHLLRSCQDQPKLWNQPVPLTSPAAAILTTREYNRPLVFIAQTGLKKAHSSWVETNLLHRDLVGPDIVAAVGWLWIWLSLVGPKQAAWPRPGIGGGKGQQLLKGGKDGPNLPPQSSGSKRQWQ